MAQPAYLLGVARGLGRGITEPHPGIIDPGERARARLLSGVLACVAATALALTVQQFFASSDPDGPLADRYLGLLLLGSLVMAGLYVLSRTGRYRWTAWALVVIMALLTLADCLAVRQSTVDFAYLMLPVVLASLVFSVRVTAVILGGVIVGTAVVYRLSTDLVAADIGNALTFLAACGGLVLLVAVVRRNDQRRLAQQAEALLTNQEALRQSEEGLRQAQRLEAVGSLAGGVAHDFNNMLTAIIGQTDLLGGAAGVPAPFRQGLVEIRSAADRAAGLTRQLLAFSRRQALQPRVLDLTDIVQPLAGMLARLLGEHVELAVRAQPGLWKVRADPTQIEQVVMNLALNARDAMPGGGGLTLDLRNVDVDAERAATHTDGRAGAFVLLTVTDTGCGMDAGTLAHIYEPFFTTKAVGEGTGLGLSTVYGVVRQSGGFIRAWSLPGEGCIFEVYLPRVDGAVDWKPSIGVPSTAGLEATPDDALILVVEDEVLVRGVVERILRGHGYRVLGTGAPAEALALYDDLHGVVDLILTDVVLPGMNGRAMVERLLTRPGPAPRVLYMSGYTQDAIVHGGHVDKGVSFLEKPFTADGLLASVRVTLDGDAGGGPPLRRPLASGSA